MKFSSILYAGFCLMVLGLFVFVSMNGFSPFADGGRRSFVHTAYGPTHK